MDFTFSVKKKKIDFFSDIAGKTIFLEEAFYESTDKNGNVKDKAYGILFHPEHVHFSSVCECGQLIGGFRNILCTTC